MWTFVSAGNLSLVTHFSLQAVQITSKKGHHISRRQNYAMNGEAKLGSDCTLPIKSLVPLHFSLRLEEVHLLLSSSPSASRERVPRGLFLPSSFLAPTIPPSLPPSPWDSSLAGVPRKAAAASAVLPGRGAGVCVTSLKHSEALPSGIVSCSRPQCSPGASGSLFAPLSRRKERRGEGEKVRPRKVGEGESENCQSTVKRRRGRRGRLVVANGFEPSASASADSQPGGRGGVAASRRVASRHWEASSFEEAPATAIGRTWPTRISSSIS